MKRSPGCAKSRNINDKIRRPEIGHWRPWMPESVRSSVFADSKDRLAAHQRRYNSYFGAQLMTNLLDLPNSRTVVASTTTMTNAMRFTHHLLSGRENHIGKPAIRAEKTNPRSDFALRMSGLGISVPAARNRMQFLTQESTPQSRIGSSLGPNSVLR